MRKPGEEVPDELVDGWTIFGKKNDQWINQQLIHRLEDWLDPPRSDREVKRYLLGLALEDKEVDPSDRTEVYAKALEILEGMTDTLEDISVEPQESEDDVLWSVSQREVVAIDKPLGDEEEGSLHDVIEDHGVDPEAELLAREDSAREDPRELRSYFLRLVDGWFNRVLPTLPGDGAAYQHLLKVREVWVRWIEFNGDLEAPWADKKEKQAMSTAFSRIEDEEVNEEVDLMWTATQRVVRGKPPFPHKGPWWTHPKHEGKIRDGDAPLKDIIAMFQVQWDRLDKRRERLDPGPLPTDEADEGD